MSVKRLSSYIGAAVIDEKDGKMKGFLKDCVGGENCIEGMLVQKNGVMHKQTYLPYKAVKSLGDYEIRADFSFAGPAERKEAAPIYNAEIGLLGADGRKIGRVSDIGFEAESGEIAELEINRGVFCDMTKGRNTIRDFRLRKKETGEYEAISLEGEE